MDPNEIRARLAEQFGDAVEVCSAQTPSPYLRVPLWRWPEIARVLRDDATLAFDCLLLLSGVDFPAEERMECVYHFLSYTHRHRLTVKVGLSRASPRVASMVSLWPAAEWHERETYDLMGIFFEGHPDLTRILLPEDWAGHPLRKDYVAPESYHGISNACDAPARDVAEGSDS
jgi:NADH-quinone oxidoreductase subunit C